MKYSNVYLESFGYEIAPVVVSSAELEERLAPVYESLHLSTGMTLEAWVKPTSLASPANGWVAAIAKDHQNSSNDISYALYAAGGTGTGPGGRCTDLLPIKLPEYLAVGLPVVAASFEVLNPLRHVVALRTVRTNGWTS